MVNDTPRIAAVVLAGGNVPKALAGLCTHRALLPIGGRPMLAYLLDTLLQTPSLVATAAIAPKEALSAFSHLPILLGPSADTLVDNMQAGARLLADHRPTHLLFITGDIPLVTVDGLEAYMTASLQSGAALTYPIIPQADCEARFPGAKRTYVRIKEGTFTGGNAIFATASLLDDKRELIQSLYSARKQPLKLAGILGWSTVMRLLVGSLTLPYLETVAAGIMSAPIRAIVTPYPEIGFDIDKPEDLSVVERTVAAMHQEK